MPRLLGISLLVLVLTGVFLAPGDLSRDARRDEARDEASLALEALEPDRGPASGATLEHLDRARELYQGLLAEDALSPRDIFQLVSIEELHGRLTRDPSRTELIARELADAVERDPFSFGLWGERGWWLARLGRLDEATEAWDRAVALYPGDARLHLDAGAIRVRRVISSEALPSLRDRACAELEAALDLARVSRLDRLHLSDAEIATARGLLLSLGTMPP